MKKTVLSRLCVVGLSGALAFTGVAVLNTSAPVVDATESITVPDVQTGEPKELEVEKDPASSAEAAAYMYMNCGARWTSGLQVDVSPHGVLASKCGGTAGSGGNSISRVRDLNGPICVYYSGTLAGCASKGSWAWVGNRSGASGELRTQSVRT